MFGFPTDLFGIPNNNHRMNSNALIPHQQSLFGNSLMIPSPFAGINSLISNFGMNSSPFTMMYQRNSNSVAPIQSFTSTTVMSYNGTDGRPTVYQETTSRNRGPGGIEETRQAVRDSERGINKVNKIHHHHSTANRRGLQAITISYQHFLLAAAFLSSLTVGGSSLLISLAT